MILKLFKTMLLDEDSYVFLGAVTGLITAGGVYPDEVLSYIILVLRSCSHSFGYYV